MVRANRTMEIKGVYNTDDSKSSPSTLRNEIRHALSTLKAKGVKDWEILDVWSEIAHEQGCDAVADTLASAAFELGKPSE